MPMYMDSPGYSVTTRGRSLKVLVPAQRIKSATFKCDAVTCYMQVSAPPGQHAPDGAKPMLGVYEVFEVLSGTLTLPYAVVAK
jgi:hypothetical protein